MAKKIKSISKRRKDVKRSRRIVTTIEVLFMALIISALVVWYVPGLKTQLLKCMASNVWGQKIISWFGSQAYNDGMYDSDFDSDSLKVNNLKYNYSKEYTNFVMFGVDSRNKEVDTSNSDSILIVSIHNTTGKVKMASVYRDTYLGIYDKLGTQSGYFKINSAYSKGGPEAAINTLNMNLDLDLKDYLTVNFGGVSHVIDTLGGVSVNLTEDEKQQLNYHLCSTISSTGRKAKKVKKAGKNIKLNGIQAATYCRIRKATFYDPNTGEAISNDFGRAARQRSVVMKLVDKAKKASVTELQDMVETVMNSDNKKKRIISTSFSFDEIVNLIPVIFDFELEGTTGFPSQLTTGTIDGASLVIPKGVSANVTELHKFLYGEENYVPTATVQSIDNYVKGYTGVNEMSEGYDPIKSGIVDKEAITKKNDFDYDDHWISPYYK